MDLSDRRGDILADWKTTWGGGGLRGALDQRCHIGFVARDLSIYEGDKEISRDSALPTRPVGSAHRVTTSLFVCLGKEQRR